MNLEQGGSPFNAHPDVAAQLAFPEDVYLVDSTIRSLQSGVSGSRHSAQDLVELGVLLDGLGVREIIVNASWVGGLEVLEGLSRLPHRSRLVATFRARHPRWKEWAAAAIDAGAEEICLESAADVPSLEAAATFVRDRGAHVSHAFAESYDYEQVVTLVKAGTALDCQSQSFHDSFFRLGIHPDAMRFFIGAIKADAPQAPPLYVHLSNFYGHATMTAVAALTAGASAVDVCANGTGHHCGHTSLSEVALVLEHLYGVDTGIDTARLAATVDAVTRVTGVPLPLTQPVIGSHAFLGDGAYWAAEAHLPFSERIHASFPFAPQAVGGTERVVWNHRTLTEEAVEHKLRSLGIQSSPASANLVIEALAGALAQHPYPNWLEDEEFSTLIRHTLNGVAR